MLKSIVIFFLSMSVCWGLEFLLPYMAMLVVWHVFIPATMVLVWYYISDKKWKMVERLILGVCLGAINFTYYIFIVDKLSTVFEICIVTIGSLIYIVGLTKYNGIRNSTGEVREIKTEEKF